MILHRSWAVVDEDKQTTVLITRWRWYAAWWAACLRIYEGADARITPGGARTPPTLGWQPQPPISHE